MPGGGLPQFAAWRHHGSRDGFEVVFVRSDRDGLRLEGGTIALDEHDPWIADYVLALGSDWLTRSALVSSRSQAGAQERRLEADAAGGWRIDGAEAPDLDGCLDVDLESSALTNAFPVHRLRLDVGEAADAPAAYVRAVDLRVERLEQRYVRLADDGNAERYHYAAPAFGFECELRYDESGLVLEYPAIATRAA